MPARYNGRIYGLPNLDMVHRWLGFSRSSFCRMARTAVTDVSYAVDNHISSGL